MRATAVHAVGTSGTPSTYIGPVRHPENCYYCTIGVLPSSSGHDIRKAYRTKSLMALPFQTLRNEEDEASNRRGMGIVVWGLASVKISVRSLIWICEACDVSVSGER
jgi:hypothetical protein